MITVIGQDGEEYHKQQLEQAAGNGEFQTHFQLPSSNSKDKPVARSMKG